MKKQGLGDVIEKIITVTGIRKIAEKIPGNCGCAKRRDLLNKVKVPKI